MGLPSGTAAGVSISAGMLKNCRVQWNTATNGSGGGVFATGAGSVITNCEIVSNQALWANSPDAGGGGVKLASAASLVNSRILYNNSPIYWTGGGGVNAGGGSLVANCHIISNKLGAQYAPGTAWGGGGVWAAGANAVILRNCLVMGNGGGNQDRGGGVGTMSGSADIQNCTVLRNVGSGIGTDRASTYRVVNTISYYNSGVDMTSVGGTLNASNCILGSTNTITGGSDNSTEPPAFRQWAGGDYRLAPWSYGVDAGLVLGWMSAASDLAGEPRLSPNNLVDIGAYETTAGGPPTVYYVAREGQTPVPPYTNGWAAAASNLADAVGVVSDGATILVSIGWYPQGGELTVGYFTLRSCKDGAADPAGTVLAGGYPAVSNRCMTLNHVKARVEGFTITNFYAPTNGGGGVYMTAGTLANCRITGNTATKHPEEVKAFLAWLATPEGAQTTADYLPAGFFPMINAPITFQNERVTDILALNQGKTLDARFIWPKMMDYYTPMVEQLNAICRGETTPAAAADVLAALQA